MSPTQIKLGLAAAMALLAWLLTDRNSKPAPRVTTEIEVEANVYNKNFGLTQAQIDAQNASANPAVNQDMRDLIDLSNHLIAEDDAAQ